MIAFGDSDPVNALDERDSEGNETNEHLSMCVTELVAL